MADKVYLAIDLGASSGRHMAGLFDGERLRLEELHRFENGPITMADTMYWDILRLWSEILDGLRAASKRLGDSIVSVGVDTWGVDFGLLARDDTLLGNPLHYRNARFADSYQQALEIVPRADIFSYSGLQFMQINTLYQLYAMRLDNSPLLEAAESLLMIPDLLHWMLSGQKCNEMSDASTTQFYNPVTGDWAHDLLNRLDIPTNILGQIALPGTNLGQLRCSLAEEVGLPKTNVVLPASHDTGSAVMAVPASWPPSDNPDWCYISLGTWALMGIESPRPIINSNVLDLNFTNEGGVGGTSRVLKNICGMWLLQECRRVWAQQGKAWSWDELTAMAKSASPRQSFIYPDAPDFLAPADMPEAIREFCKKTGQPVPADESAVLRCALDSLALRFRQVLEMCESLSGQAMKTIHIVGGGTQNHLLCQLTADATCRPVLAGPIEATAIGNVMMQAVAAGDVAGIGEAREVIRRSFEVDSYSPVDTASWDDAYETYKTVVEPYC